jgi:outer membrane protein
MKLWMNKKLLIILYSGLLLCMQGHSQSVVDSLTFEDVMRTVLKNNPVLKQAENKIISSEWKEQLAKTSYLPTINVSASLNRLYPNPPLDLTFPNPQTGEMVTTHLQMYPDFGMDYKVEMSQMIFDFGKTHSNLGTQQTQTEISRLGEEQLKQRLALTVVEYFYNLLFVQYAISIRNEEVNTLNQHLEIVKDKQLTGSATQYEVLSTQVRISTMETQLEDLLTSNEILVSHLNSLMGNEYPSFAVKNDLIFENPSESMDSLYNFALSHRYDILLAVKNKSLAEWNYRIEQSRINPSLSFYGATGIKNGYVSDINAMKYNYIAGVSLKVPIFDGNRHHINKQIAGIGIEDSKAEIENLNYRISDEVKEKKVSLELSGKKIEQFSVQLEQASEAYNHAKTNYEAGVITNLDLLDAANILADSKLLLLKARIDYAQNLMKYKAALGNNLY